MAPPLANSFEGGSNGVTIDTSNSGGASGNAFDFVSAGGCTFSTAQAHGGSLSMSLVDQAAATWATWWALGSIATPNPVYLRWYMYLTAYPTTSRHYIARVNANGSGACAHLRIMADGTGVMSAADASNSGFGAEGAVGVALNQWVRMEARIVASTTVGELAWRLYNSPDSTTITDSFTSAANLALAANIDEALFGMPTGPAPATPYTAYFDDLAVSTTDWIGPVPTGQTLLPDADLDAGGWATAPLYSKWNDASDATLGSATAS